MNIQAAGSPSVHLSGPVTPLKSVEARHASASHDSMSLGETQGVGSHGDHLALSEDVSAAHHPLATPLKILAVHGGVMALEQGAHYALNRLPHKKEGVTTRAGSGPMQTVGAVAGAAASGYLAYTAFEHARHAADAGHHKAAAAYALSGILDAGLAVANTLSAVKMSSGVSMGTSLGVGAAATVASMWAADIEQKEAAAH